MSESNYETSVKHDESLQLLSTRFISLLKDVKDGLLDLKMGGDILAVVLKGTSCNTLEKTKILKLKEELQDLKNKEIEIDFNYASEKQEEECQDVGGKTKDKDEAMEQGDSDDNNKSKVTSAQPTRQLPPRKAAQRHLCIQSRHHDNVKNKKTSTFNKKQASTKERPTIRGRVREKDKVSSESTVPASIFRVKDSLEEENEKKVSEKTSRDRIATLNQQNNDAKGQHTANRPVNSRVNTRANSQSKTPLEYHGQDSFGEHEESGVPYVTDTENLHITANLYMRGKKVYGFKEISAQPIRQLPPRKAAQRHFFIQSRHHDNVKTKKISALKTEASPKERPTVRGRGGEKEKVSSESTYAASVSKAKDDVSEEEENEKEVREKTITRSRSRILTLNQQTNEPRSQDTENHPVNNQVNSRVNIQAKAPLEYHGQDTLGKHEESEVPYVTGTENHKITASKKLFPKGRKVYGCPYECGFVCKPGMRYTVTRHLNSHIMFGTLRKPSCPIRRKMEVVRRDGTWPKSVKEPVFLGTAVTDSGREEYKAAISRAKSKSLAEENGKKVPEKTKTRSRGRISTLNQKNNETRSQDTENHPVNSRMKRLASYQDKAFLEYPDLVGDLLQSIKKLCSLPSRRDYFFQLDKYTGVVDLFEIKDPNIDRKYEKFDGPNVTDNFARPRIICRPQFEAFLRREMYGSGKEVAKEVQIKYRCPYCFMLSLYRENIERHIQSRKGYGYGEWRGPACIVRRHKEPNPSGIYESKWPCPKRTPIIEIDCTDILILIYSQLGIRIPGNCLREKKGSKVVRLDS